MKRFEDWWALYSRGDGDMDAHAKKAAWAAWLHVAEEAERICERLEVTVSATPIPVTARYCALVI